MCATCFKWFLDDAGFLAVQMDGLVLLKLRDCLLYILLERAHALRNKYFIGHQIIFEVQVTIEMTIPICCFCPYVTIIAYLPFVATFHLRVIAAHSHNTFTDIHIILHEGATHYFRNRSK